MYNKITKESISGSQQIFDRKQIILKQHNLRRLYETYKGTDEIEYFAKIKFRDIMYQVGDFIQLETTNKSEFYVAKLKKVIRVKVKGRPQAFIEVQWVLKKSDLPEHLLRLYADYISTAEVFPSNEKIYLYVASIRCKCTLLSIQEYAQLGNAPQSIFYSRSNYHSESKNLVPDPSTWPSDCFCRKPNNPDLAYVQCNGCGKWHHVQCAGPRIINGDYLCAACFNRGMIDERSER